MKNTLVYVRWRDAVHSMDEHEISGLGDLVELHEVGFLLKETPETVTLSIEIQKDATSTRMWLTVPKVNIVEIRHATLDKAFPDPKAGKRKPGRPRKSLAQGTSADVPPQATKDDPA